MRRFRFIVLLLSLSLISAAGFAAEPRSSTRPLPAPSAWAGTLAQSFLGFLKNLWSADGCAIDPLGRCTTKPTTDSSCRIDPLGRCIQATQSDTDNGCRIDPLGLCK